MTKKAPWTKVPGAVTAANKQRKRLRPVSAQMQRRLVEYRKLRDSYMKQYPLCEACLWLLASRPTTVTVHRGTELHHKRGRGQFLCDTSTFMNCCNEHHRWIGDHPAEAMKRGWILSRLQKL